MGMATDLDCIFCLIIQKKMKADIIAETDRVIAFHDVNPVANLHVLILPKLHVANINEMTKENAGFLVDMMMLAKELARKFNVDRSGYRLVINTERNAGQTVFHLHLHLLGGREFCWPPG
jgi:histidine triad (HIT) family protein